MSEIADMYRHEFDCSYIAVNGRLVNMTADQLIETAELTIEHFSVEPIVPSICKWFKEKGFITPKQRIAIISILAGTLPDEFEDFFAEATQ